MAFSLQGRTCALQKDGKYSLASWCEKLHLLSAVLLAGLHAHWCSCLQCYEYPNQESRTKNQGTRFALSFIETRCTINLFALLVFLDEGMYFVLYFVYHVASCFAGLERVLAVSVLSCESDFWTMTFCLASPCRPHLQRYAFFLEMGLVCSSVLSSNSRDNCQGLFASLFLGVP